MKRVRCSGFNYPCNMLSLNLNYFQQGVSVHGWQASVALAALLYLMSLGSFFSPD